MHILKTVHSLNPAGGGVATAVDALSRAEIALGHTVEIACLDDPASPWLTNLPYMVHAFNSPPIFRSYGWCPALSEWLRQNMQRYEVATIEGLWQYHGKAVWRATRAANIPYVVYPHGMLDPWFQRAYPRKHLKKTLYWKLGGHRVLRDALAVAFTTEEEMRLAENSFQPWQARAVISPLGVQLPTENSAARASHWRKSFPELIGKKYLLFLGRIDPKKGADLLLSAYASTYSSAERSRGAAPLLVIAGPELHPNFSSDCRNLMQQLDLRDGADVIWAGHLDQDLKWAALESADALALPSHQENFGYVVAEALAVGTPVLISNKVNLFREVVADGAGVAAPDDLEGARQLLETYRSWSVEDRTRYSTAARKCFMARYQIEAAARRQIDVLNGAN